MIGEKIGKYLIEEEIGVGGMATVYRGIDQVLERPVAIKILHPHLSKDTDAVQRFVHEATAIAKLHHPNIVEIYDFSTTKQGMQYLVMEYVEGRTLAEHIEQKGAFKFPESAACMAWEIASGLEHAHQHRIIHRDLKAENVMVRAEDGAVKLMDFGIARLLEKPTMTSPGDMLGSPAYMSPELLAGRQVSFQSDIFSMGNLLYLLVTGMLPFAGQNTAVVLNNIQSGHYRNPQEINPLVSKRYRHILSTCLQRDPKDRYASVAEFKRDLHQLFDAYRIVHPAQEIQQLFADRAAYHQVFREHMLEVLEDKARKAHEEAQLTKTLKYCDRLFAIDEHNALATTITAQLMAVVDDEREPAERVGRRSPSGIWAMKG